MSRRGMKTGRRDVSSSLIQDVLALPAGELLVYLEVARIGLEDTGLREFAAESLDVPDEEMLRLRGSIRKLLGKEG